MTFYNVISGILFLGACQAFFVALGTSAMWAAATLAAIIVNESVLTSELLERRASTIEYELDMKLLDCVTFGVLLWALLILSPVSNTLNVDVSTSLRGAGSPHWFWGLLTGYWLLTLVWNWRARQLKKDVWKPWFIWCMRLAWLPFLIAAIITCKTDTIAAMSPWIGRGTLLLVIAYVISKLFARARQA